VSSLALGLDLGSSGLRLALAESTPQGDARLLNELSSSYPRPFADPQGWLDGLRALVAQLDPALRGRVGAIAIAGTSGTLLCCRPEGSLLPGQAGLALPYHCSIPEQAESVALIAADPSSPAASASGSLARALRLLALIAAESSQARPPSPQRSTPMAGSSTEFAPAAADHPPAVTLQEPTLPTAAAPGMASPATPEDRAGPSLDARMKGRSPAGRGSPGPPLADPACRPPLLLRHQADWLMGWLLGDWRWGEEGNNLRLGWDLQRQAWSGSIAEQPWAAALPQICPSGADLGRLSPAAAAALGLPGCCRVVAGSTDANAGVLAADPRPGDGITVLGSTLVLKQFVDAPICAPGVSCHRVAGRWLLGGASNAGAGILRRFFDDDQIRELSRQIDPRRPSGLDLLPLPGRGERFPVDDPSLEPRLEPRPTSDALFLQALLEGLTALELRGWRRLRELGAPPLRRVITLGGGARNPQWRSLRQRALGVPVLQRPGLSAAFGMARLALVVAGRREACESSCG